MVVTVGVIALVVVVGLFVSTIVVSLIAEKRRSQRQLAEVERKIDRLIYAAMSPEEKARERERIRVIEEQNRRAHGIGGY